MSKFEDKLQKKYLTCLTKMISRYEKFIPIYEGNQKHQSRVAAAKCSLGALKYSAAMLHKQIMIRADRESKL